MNFFKNKYFIKTSVILLSVCLILFSIVSIQENSHKPKSEEEAFFSYFKLQEERGELTEKYGENNIYPDIRVGAAEGMLFGESLENSLAEIKRIYIEREALYWYAGKQGIHITDDEVNDRIKEQVSEMKEADNVPEMSDEEYLAIEESMKKSKDWHKKTYTIEALYEKEYDKYYPTATMSWDSYRNKFEKRVLGKFKKTSNYRTLKKATKDAGRVVLRGTQPTNEEIKRLDVLDKLDY